MKVHQPGDKGNGGETRWRCPEDETPENADGKRGEKGLPMEPIKVPADNRTGAQDFAGTSERVRGGRTRRDGNGPEEEAFATEDKFYDA